jgi:hypothetical protein
LDGFDIDYEQGFDDSFVRVMGQVMQGYYNQTNGAFTIAPFNGTSEYYKSLYQNNSTYIAFINYQAYADGLENQPNPVTAYTDLYAQLAQPDYAHTYSTLGLGIDSNTQNPRGLQPPDIFTVWDNLHSQGVQCAMIWSLEDSASNGFVIENYIQNNS